MTLREKLGLWMLKGKEAESPLAYIPRAWYGTASGEIVLGNYQSYIRANSGTVANCTRLRGEGVSLVERKLYITKRRKDTKFLDTRTKELGQRERDYVMKVAHKYVQDAAEVVEVVEHPVLDLLRNVNIGWNEADLKHMTSAWQDVTGNCYWYLPKNGLKIPAEVQIIFSQYMKVKTDKETRRVTGYIYKNGSTEIHYEKDEIIHFRLPSLTSYYYGDSVIAGAADMIDMRAYMTEYNQSRFKNMGDLGGIVAFKSNVPPEMMKRLKAQWDAEHIGANKAGAWAYVPGGNDGVDIHPFDAGSKEMGFHEGYVLTKEEICNTYGIPIGTLSSEGSQSYASAKVHELYMAKHSVLPRVINHDAALNEQLLPLYEKSSERLFFLSESPVPEDREIAMQERQTNITTGVHSINEERSMDGLETWDGYDRPFQQMSLMQHGSSEATEREIEALILRAATKAKEQLRAAV